MLWRGASNTGRPGPALSPAAKKNPVRCAVGLLVVRTGLRSHPSAGMGDWWQQAPVRCNPPALFRFLSGREPRSNSQRARQAVAPCTVAERSCWGAGRVSAARSEKSITPITEPQRSSGAGGGSARGEPSRPDPGSLFRSRRAAAAGILSGMADVTQLLDAAAAGDPHALAELLPLVYDELHQLAAARLAEENPGQTLQATALVHEAYLRLVGDGQPQKWDGCKHFFAAAAEAMRRILIDRARHKRTHKAGGGRRQLDLDDIEPALEEENDDRLLALDEALRQLEAEHPRKAALVKLRFFAGLTAEQAAAARRLHLHGREGLGVRPESWLRVAIDRIPGPERPGKNRYGFDPGFSHWVTDGPRDPSAEAPMTAPRPDNEAIFHTARDIPDPDRRRAYVREACGGDEARIAHVEALLAAADGPDSLLDRPAGTPEATIDPPTTESPGTVIGPYKLIEPIGEGGMGSVWMAQQTSPVKLPGRCQADPHRARPVANDRLAIRGRAPGDRADGPPVHRQTARRRDHRSGSAVLRDGAGQGGATDRILRHP